MTNSETLRELFPRDERKGNYILISIDKYEELISKAAALDDIRAEIKQEMLRSETTLRSAGVEAALDIIDRHIGKEKE